MKRIHRTKEQMYPLIEDFINSRMKLNAYCKLHSFNYNNYRYWLGKYKADPHRESVKKSSSLNFIPINLVGSSIDVQEFKIVYPNGVQIVLSSTLSLEGLSTLKQLILCLD